MWHPRFQPQIREPVGEIQSGSKGLKTRGANPVSLDLMTGEWGEEIWVWRSENQDLWCPRGGEGQRLNSQRKITSAPSFLYSSRADLLYIDRFICWFLPETTLTDTPRSRVLPSIGHPLAPVKFTYKIKQHHLILSHGESAPPYFDP